MDACEWKYQMRHEIQEVIPHLWVGPYSCARDLEYCKRFGITHMLCVMDSAEKYRLARKHPDHFIYHDIDVTDSPLQNLIPFFPAAKAFIKSALDQGGTVLVYCNNGISRSPSFVIAYVMEANGWDFATAFNFVQNKRFCMNPLEGFKIQLKEYEPIFQARASISELNYTPHQVLMQGTRRRPLEDDDEMM